MNYLCMRPESGRTPEDVGRIVSCAVDVCVLSSAYLVSFTCCCVIAVCHDFLCVLLVRGY